MHDVSENAPYEAKDDAIIFNESIILLDGLEFIITLEACKEKGFP
uniref:Uncharacterized protein n=1 Tax=Lepeophtheirus salmonis TaxID=72036 RepID=A0A0K2VF51_LEPSM